MLVYTLSLLLAYTAFISTLEVAALAAGLAMLMYLVTPQASSETEPRVPPSFYYYLQWSWLGYLPLRQVFWPFFLLFNCLLLFIDYQVQEGDFTIAAWVTTHVILAMPIIYWTGAVWRCSVHCSKQYWAVAARWLVVLTYLDFGLRWVIYHFYPQIFFDCAQLINHWGDCI